MSSSADASSVWDEFENPENPIYAKLKRDRERHEVDPVFDLMNALILRAIALRNILKTIDQEKDQELKNIIQSFLGSNTEEELTLQGIRDELILILLIDPHKDWNEYAPRYNAALYKIKKIQKEFGISSKDMDEELEKILCMRKPKKLEGDLTVGNTTYHIDYAPLLDKQGGPYPTSHSKKYAYDKDKKQLKKEELIPLANFRKISIRKKNKSGNFFEYLRYSSIPAYWHYKKFKNDLLPNWKIFKTDTQNRHEATFYQGMLGSILEKFSTLRGLTDSISGDIHEHMMQVISPGQFHRLPWWDSDRNAEQHEDMWLMHEMMYGYKKDDFTFKPTYFCVGINDFRHRTTAFQEKINQQALYRLRAQMNALFKESFGNVSEKEIDLSEINQKINTLREKLIQMQDKDFYSSEENPKDFLNIKKQLKELIVQRQKLELEAQKKHEKEHDCDGAHFDHLFTFSNNSNGAIVQGVQNLARMYSDMQEFMRQGHWKDPDKIGQMQALHMVFCQEMERFSAILQNPGATFGSVMCKSTEDRGPSVGRQALYLASLMEQNGGVYESMYERSNIKPQRPWQRRTPDIWAGFNEFLNQYHTVGLDVEAHRHSKGCPGGKNPSNTALQSRFSKLLSKGQPIEAFTPDAIAHEKRRWPNAIEQDNRLGIRIIENYFKPPTAPLTPDSPQSPSDSPRGKSNP